VQQILLASDCGAGVGGGGFVGGSVGGGGGVAGGFGGVFGFLGGGGGFTSTGAGAQHGVGLGAQQVQGDCGHGFEGGDLQLQIPLPGG